MEYLNFSWARRPVLGLLKFINYENNCELKLFA